VSEVKGLLSYTLRIWIQGRVQSPGQLAYVNIHAEGLVFDHWKEQAVFLCPDRLLSCPVSYLKVTGALSFGVNWSGREANDLPPYSAEVKDRRSIPPLSHTYLRR
jgi:hypothetical protein